MAKKQTPAVAASKKQKPTSVTPVKTKKVEPNVVQPEETVATVNEEIIVVQPEETVTTVNEEIVVPVTSEINTDTDFWKDPSYDWVVDKRWVGNKEAEEYYLLFLC